MPERTGFWGYKTNDVTEEAECDRLRSFLAVACQKLFSESLLRDGHPIMVLDRLRKDSPRRALRGLREAVGDMVEATKSASGVELAALDASLAKAGAPSLRSMRERRSRAIFAILERGRIESDEEWRLISGVLSDIDERLLSGPLLEAANELFARYENSEGQ